MWEFLFPISDCEHLIIIIIDCMALEVIQKGKTQLLEWLLIDLSQMIS